MYDNLTKSQAFLFFCQGFSFRKIAEILQTHPGCEGLTHTTVKKWSETPDEQGLTWEDRRREYSVVMARTEQSTAIRQHLDIVQATERIKNDLIDEIGSKSLQFKTRDAAIYALVTLMKYQDSVVERGQRVSLEDKITLLLDAMNEIDEVREVLLKHWEAIIDRFNKKATELMREKRRG